MNNFVNTQKRIYSIIHTKIYKRLLKHPFIDAIAAVIKQSNDQEFCKMVAGRNDLSMICRCYGEQHKDKNIYYINYGKRTSGFFAQFRTLLKYLAYADRFGFAPVVLWDSSLPYAEKDEIFGTTNPFEYYFLQPSNISVSEVFQSYNVFFAQDVHVEQSFLDREFEEDGYWMSEQYMEQLSRYVKKYIRLTPYTEKYMNDNIYKLLGNRETVGVHFRGTDYNNLYHNHPVNISVEEYFEVIDGLLKKEQYKQIFVATDDVRILTKFSDRYGSMLLYYEDVIRGEQNQSVAFCENERKNHKYLLGLEVLRDMYTLTSCQALVAGISQVSLMARVFKKSTGCDYRDKIILDKGYNNNNNIFVV